MAVNNVGRPRTPGFKLGQMVGGAKVVAYAHITRKDGYVYEGYQCQCACGSVVYRAKAQLRSDGTARCRSCAGKENAAKRDYSRHSKHPFYKAWQSMHNRCRNPEAQAYYNYGARGITVCARWNDFYKFVEDMGPRPDGYTLERRNNNKGYSPRNCCWATTAEQNNNTRGNRWITIDGERKTITQWARALGTRLSTVRNRIEVFGWSERDACTVPVAPRKKRNKQE